GCSGSRLAAADLDAAADAEPAPVAAGGGRLDVVGYHQRGRGRRVALALLLAGRLVAQREFQPLLAGLEARVLQRPLERGGVAAQQVERVGALDHEVRADV